VESVVAVAVAVACDHCTVLVWVFFVGISARCRRMRCASGLGPPRWMMWQAVGSGWNGNGGFNHFRI
jgi:hypothetical protein